MDPEQLICVGCGFCCDGTLFNHAVLDLGQKGNLPEKIEEQYFLLNAKEYFKLPCLYFDGKCTIYDQKKANICSRFRCQLLNYFADKNLSKDDALSIIQSSKNLRDELLEEFELLTGKTIVNTFRQLLEKIGRIQKDPTNQLHKRPEFEFFIARCNIFESLLIKHFKSEKVFMDMVITSE